MNVEESNTPPRKSDQDFGAVAFPWYCIRTQPKREAIAAQQLPTLEGVTVFNPRIRHFRKTKEGPKITTESLFPGYIFASFDFWNTGKQVGFTRGVARIVRRTNLDPIIVPDAVMEGLFALSPDGIVRVGSPEFKIGDEVRIIAGVFSGLETQVVKIIPGTRRVAVLMQLLGQEQEIIVESAFVDFPENDPRRRL